jgi:diguanylate cyclase (GGDEF)-like protein
MTRKTIAVFLGWTLLVVGSLLWNLHTLEQNLLNNAASIARAKLAKDIGFRNWAASHGGVYVQPTARTRPNPYLNVPDRDVATPSGMKLMLMNPAYVLREVQENSNSDKKDLSHLTSLRLMNPDNQPDPWEIKALKSFAQGSTEMMEVSDIGGEPYLRLMQALPVTQDCLPCHAAQGYQLGQVRGGIGAYVLLRPFTLAQSSQSQQLILSHSLIWLTGLFGFGMVRRRERAAVNAQAQIDALAFYDPLTHLSNRRLLMDRLDQALHASTRHARKSALLFVDLDNFKTLNDTRGHQQGNQLLTLVAQRLQGCSRDGDTVAHLGSDEFVVMLQDLSEDIHEAANQAETVGEKMLAALNQDYPLDGGTYHGTTSIGITLFGSAQQEGSDEPLKRAELAMFQAKAAGRNTLRFFDAQMQAEVSARAALEADLREAVHRQQLVLHYQPQVVGAGRITGVEALVRWQHPLRGMVSPAEFIPLAEETGLILPIGQWVLETACAQLAAWAKEPELAHLTMAVNVSARQFKQLDFVESVLRTLACTQAAPQLLKLELTESMLVDDVQAIIAKMGALKAQGVGFALDDFGTGYSSLSYLKRLPLDQLKIDQSFVRNIVTDPNDAAIAKMVVVLASSLGLSWIAEGVELQAQADVLAKLGCHAYQGYLFSRPLPLAAFEALARMPTAKK